MIKNLMLIISIIFFSVALLLFSYLLRNEEICCRYEMCKYLTNICKSEEQYTALSNTEGKKLYIEELEEFYIDDSVVGKISNEWFFEGEFPITVFNEEGDLIATLIAKTDEDWTVSDEIKFSFKLDFDLEESSELVFRFERSNPSGLEENDEYIEWKREILVREKEVVVKIYFANSKMESPEDCEKVYPVERKVVSSSNLSKISIEELLKGVSSEEKQLGYYSNIGEGVEVLSIESLDNTIKVDFSKELEEGVGGSCRVSSIRSQIKATLLQFDSSKEVIISIEGRTEDILQP
ncbi:MAG: GerMN domain-containing protein [Candidatus Dojkabacteria bacterium]